MLGNIFNILTKLKPLFDSVLNAFYLISFTKD